MARDMHRNIDPNSFGYMMTETARLLRAAFERRLADAGLPVTPAEARTLGYIAVNEGSRQNLIAERMGVEPMTVSENIDRLEQLGLVTRTQDPADRRAKQVSTTEVASALLTNINEQAQPLFHESRSGIGDADWLAFLTVLRALRDNLRTMLAERQNATAAGTDMK